MARETRQKGTTSSPRKTGRTARPAPRTTSRARAAAKAKPPAPKSSVKGAGRTPPRQKPPKPNARPTATAIVSAAKPDRAVAQQAPPAPRKPGYYEALAMYESGVRALQRHDYQGAATQFRSIMERYPEERELQERSALYLRVCERETARRPATPQTPQERVYAATVALNAGDTATALDHLRRALSDSPDSDHAHYIMSVALAAKGDSGQALEHLRQAISLNPENRSLARQDPDLEPVRGVEEFRELLDAPGGPGRSKPRKKR